MIRKIMLYLLALFLFWLSYLQFAEILQNGVLRTNMGYVLTGWTMYVHALVPALLAAYAILLQARKKY